MRITPASAACGALMLAACQAGDDAPVGSEQDRAGRDHDTSENIDLSYRCTIGDDQKKQTGEIPQISLMRRVTSKPPEWTASGELDGRQHAAADAPFPVQSRERRDGVSLVWEIHEADVSGELNWNAQRGHTQMAGVLTLTAELSDARSGDAPSELPVTRTYNCQLTQVWAMRRMMIGSRA